MMVSHENEFSYDFTREEHNGDDDAVSMASTHNSEEEKEEEIEIEEQDQAPITRSNLMEIVIPTEYIEYKGILKKG